MEIDSSQYPNGQLERVNKYLAAMIEHKGSDLHVKAGSNFRARIQGNVTPMGDQILTRDESLGFARDLLGEAKFQQFLETKEMDWMYSPTKTSRFRVNLFFQLNGVSAVFRVIPTDIPSFDDYQLPEVLRTFTQKERGLVLVTGVTGSGKSTTLASLINEVNEKRKKHIITIEDPVEFVHQDKQCIINQRSLGNDTLSFSNALKAALREDPDIILVGEMRDVETVNLALHAADTGHLVFSTLHTIDAKETINRIIGQFPANEQPRVRLSLASTIQGIVSQRLVKTVDGGRKAAMEILVKTARVEQLIMENRDYEIIDTIQEGKSQYGSQSFDQCLFDYYQEGYISKEEALSGATNPNDMKLKMGGIGGSGGSPTMTSSARIDTEDDDVFDLK